MAENRFLAGVGRALLFDGNNLIGVAKTLTESTFNFSISNEEIRGGQGNALFGKYFHDSNLGITLVDAMFKLEYLAANLGVDINMGGLSIYESPSAGEVVGAGGVITLTNTPTLMNGSLLAWYKKPSDANWSIATIAQSGSSYTITIPDGVAGDAYCIKYFYQNENARSIIINTQYVPKTLHLVIMNDLFSGDSADIGSATRYGRIITDIPSFQLDGNQDLNLTATSAATISLTGNALGVNSDISCEEAPYYGTMTEEIFGSSWVDNVIALAIENSAELNVLGAAIPIVSVMDMTGNVIGKLLKDGTIVNEKGAVIGKPLSNGAVANLNNRVVGVLRPWGLVADLTGNVIGGIVPDGSVMDAANNVIGMVKPNGLVVNSTNDLIGGTIPQGVAVAPGCQLTGKIMQNGEVRDSYNQMVGKTLIDGSVINNDGTDIGGAIQLGLVINEKGNPIGFINSEGKAVGPQGAVIGCVSIRTDL